LPPDPDTTDHLTLEQQVCFALSVADRRLVAIYRPLLEPLGLTHPQYLLMIALWQYGPMSMRELGRLLHLDSGTLSPLVSRLETAGLVVRERGRETGMDQRSVRVSLTEGGTELRERARSVPDGVMERLGLEMGDLAALRDTLHTLIDATSRGAGLAAS